MPGVGKYKQRNRRWIAVIFLSVWVSFFCSTLQATTLIYYRYHIVQKGDSLWLVSRQYGVPVREIQRKNDLRNDRIYPNQKLIIPITIEGVYHEVKPYETLWRICRAYDNMSMEEITYLNRISDPNLITPGQKIFIPGVSEVREVEIPREVIAPQEVAPPAPIPAPAGERVSAKTFSMWPIQADIEGYERTDSGINIFAPRGASVVALARGKVYFSGWLRNYGRTIIIEHAELGLYTCYMHNSANLVEKDDFVEQGEAIATIGDSGTAGRIMLHFEIRRAEDAKPFDPLAYLPPDF